jgi:hypothetical protein
MIDYIFEPLHARFDFTLEGCADDEGLNSHGDLPCYSPSDYVMEGDLSGERVLFNPPWELAEEMACHFKSCCRIAQTQTMALFVLPKWAKFNDIPRHLKMYQEFRSRTRLFARQSVNDPTHERLLCMVLGLFNCGGSTLIVIFTI